MDPRFPLWIQLRLGSLSDAKKRIRQVQRLFDAGRIDDQILSDDRKLRDAMVSLVRADTSEVGLDPDQSSGDESDEGYERDPAREPTSRRAGSTVSHDLEALQYYTEFLGRSGRLVQEYVASIGLDAKHIQRATVSVNVQAPTTALHVISAVLSTLHARQAVLDARIRRWLRFGNLAESSESLVRFGVSELRPFIELTLRYTRLPMSAQRIARMRASCSVQVPEDAGSLYGQAARDLLRVPPGRKPHDALLVRGTRLCHVYMVFPNRGSQGKLVAHDLGQALSVYIYFYHAYCKGEPDAAVRQRHEYRGTNLLFTGVDGGPWKNVRTDVLRYLDSIGADVPVADMRLDAPAYFYTSKVQWLAARAAVYGLDTNRVASDAAAVHLGFRYDDNFHTGLRSLRRAADIHRMLQHPPAGAAEPTLRLRDLPADLDELALELAGRVPDAPAREPARLPGSEWTDVDQSRELYSREFQESMGSAETVRRYLQSQSKRTRRSSSSTPSRRSGRARQPNQDANFDYE